MATGGNLKKRIARFVRRSKEACVGTKTLFSRRLGTSNLSAPSQAGDAASTSRLEALEAQVRELRGGWDALIPEVLNTVSATHRHSLGSSSLQGRLDVLCEDVEALTLRVDLALEALFERVAALEARKSQPSSTLSRQTGKVTK